MSSDAKRNRYLGSRKAKKRKRVLLVLIVLMLILTAAASAWLVRRGRILNEEKAAEEARQKEIQREVTARLIELRKKHGLN